jgi:hypothetical protein
MMPSPACWKALLCGCFLFVLVGVSPTEALADPGWTGFIQYRAEVVQDPTIPGLTYDGVTTMQLLGPVGAGSSGGPALVQHQETYAYTRDGGLCGTVTDEIHTLLDPPVSVDAQGNPITAQAFVDAVSYEFDLNFSAYVVSPSYTQHCGGLTNMDVVTEPYPDSTFFFSNTFTHAYDGGDVIAQTLRCDPNGGGRFCPDSSPDANDAKATLQLTRLPDADSDGIPDANEANPGPITPAPVTPQAGTNLLPSTQIGFPKGIQDGHFVAMQVACLAGVSYPDCEADFVLCNCFVGVKGSATATLAQPAIAVGTATIPRGQTRTVKLPFTKRGRALIKKARKAGRKKLQATLTITDNTSPNSATTPIVVKLKS